MFYDYNLLTYLNLDIREIAVWCCFSNISQFE